MEFVLALFIVAGSMLIGGTAGELKGYMEAKAGVPPPSVSVEVGEGKTAVVTLDIEGKK